MQASIRDASLKICFFLSCALLLACQGEQIGSGLDQAQANHMVAVLNAHGIASVSKKEGGGKGNFAVWVDRSDRGEAAALIDEKGLLQRGEASLEDLLSNQGLLPGSRDIDQLKLDRALAVQLEKLLMNLPGVYSARVVVRQNFLPEGAKPSVSVVLEGDFRKGLSKEELITLARQVLPGIETEQIMVSMHRSYAADALAEEIGVLNIKGRPIPLALASFLGWWRVPKDDYTSLALALVGLLIACAFIGVIVGYWYGYYIQAHRPYDRHDLVPKVTRVNGRRVEEAKASDLDLTGVEWTRKD
ncbi:MAG: hypothetical protein GYA55_06085 [SAR324 cluster bacterium]|uniref:Flagellar M-ring N-terminal domain-containing protein n=1 Tax=SAR324 cluster bacterium TaxID=2024889 RepID=A0A7X9FQZ6_9DELT|nr:hypothetical protein [SAR324 cluster bacterium]